MVAEEVFVHLLLLRLSLVPDEYVYRFWLYGLDVVLCHECNRHNYCCDRFHKCLVYRISYVVLRIGYVILIGNDKVMGGVFARVYILFANISVFSWFILVQPVSAGAKYEPQSLQRA